MEQEKLSYAQLVAAMPAVKRAKILNSLTDEQAYYLQHDWQIKARPAQRTPLGNWFCWLLRSGRGFGKSWTGSHVVIE